MPRNQFGDLTRISCFPTPSRREFLGLLGASTLVTALPGCGGSSKPTPTPVVDYSKTKAWGEQAIQAELKANSNVAAISVALLKGNKVVWAEAFGLASVTGKVSATTNTRFNIGSVSKVIAGLTGAILHDRKLIDLDEPIVTYLPGFSMQSPEYKQITCRHLLSHSSGLPGTNGKDIFTFVPVPGYSADTLAELADTHLKHIPGELAVYCNDGFTLFEQVVLAVTGQSYPDFVQMNILDPLGMKNSGYVLNLLPDGTFAYPYSGGTQYREEVVNAYATGGLSSTPTDMMNLAQMFLNNGTFGGKTIVSADGVAAMATDQTTGTTINPSPEWKWGLGWDSVLQPGMNAIGIKAWEKNGGTAFFSTEFFVIPSAQLGLLVTGNAGYAALKVAEGILTQAMLEDGTLKTTPSTVSTTAPAAAAAADRVEDAAGIYGNSAMPVKVEVNSDGSIRLTEWNGQSWVALNAKGVTDFQYTSDGWWWCDDASVPNYQLKVVSGTDSEGNAFDYRYLMMRPVAGAGYTRITLPLGQQLAARPALSAAWQARLGSQWVLSNESPDSVALAAGNTPVTLTQLAELPGHILFGGGTLGQWVLLAPLTDDVAGMELKIPVNYGRDLFELHFSSVNGVETLTLGSNTYSKSA